MEQELYLCKINNEYLKYLHSIDYRVSVKYNNRPFVGVVTMINNIKYVIPLTSQTTTERAKAGKSKRAARITTFVRDTAGNEIANLLHNNMIPVLDTVYEKEELDAAVDTYEANEVRFIRKNKEKIIQKAKKVHDDRVATTDAFLNKTCCDFEKLEKLYTSFNKNK